MAKKNDTTGGADAPDTVAGAAGSDTTGSAPVRYVVSSGVAVTSIRRGIIGPGDEINADDVSGGAESFADLVAKGYVLPSI